SFTEVEGGRTVTTESNKEKEYLLKIAKEIAPIKVAVLPLVKNKKEITEKSKEVYSLLKKHFNCQYDETGAIGRRYRRQDEIGTPWAVTVDFESIDNDDVTLRNRDTMEQVRIKIKDLVYKINEN
ncbi:MAG: His/Gly/Thr/Pro-type tRNA ligase C-terminal domain-containing protein, partial [Candidatus Pacebacteria bacterium]|nr:His/Gly/Thr/Pro-type tRNA ligase C-terminal domain-containing protein [Candidatus Paceibacterota bacterium]